MKKVAFIIAALLSCGIAGAQSTWFCTEVGTKLHYVQTDGAGKQTSSYQNIVKDVAKEGGKTVITYDVYMPVLDRTSEGCQVWTDGKSFYTDAAASMGQIGSGLEVKGNAPVLPEKPSAGAKIEDCSVTIESLATTVKYSNIRFSREEEITTPAGAFVCWCLEYDTDSKMAFIQSSNKNEQWYAKGIGIVKYVMKDKKGKVQSVQELVQIEK